LTPLIYKETGSNITHPTEAFMSDEILGGIKGKSLTPIWWKRCMLLSEIIM